MRPVRGDELVVEFRRKREWLGAEHLLLDESQRIPLLLRLDHAKRRWGVGIPLVAARRVQAADQPRGRMHGLAMGRQQHAERLPHPLVAPRPAVLLLGGHPVGDERHHLRHQFGAALRKLQRIAPQIKPVRQWVGIAELRLFVGGVGERGLAAAAGNLVEFRQFSFGVAGRYRPVSILDRPHVVGAEFRCVVVALSLPLRHDVHRDIVHHTRTRAARGGLRHVVDIGERAESASLEVVPQPERVPHFVHRDELESLQDELLLVGIGKSPFGTGGECRRRQRSLTGVAVEERAAVAAVLPAMTVGRATSEQCHALRREGLVFGPPEPQKVAVEDDVGVEYLARPRVHPRRPHGKARTGGDPAKRVVVDVFRIPVGHVGLLADFDSRGEAGLLEGIVPHLDAFTDRLPILERHGLLDPEHDGLLGRRHRRRRIGFLEVPAVDEANEPVLVDILRKVLQCRHEVADAIVGEPRPVAVLRQQAERVVHRDRGAAGIGHGVDVPRTARAIGGGHLEFDVVGKALDPRPRGAIPREGKAGQFPGDLREIAEEDRRQVDDVATGGAGRRDGQAEQHAVGVGEIDSLFLRAALVGEEPHVLADHLDVVVDLAELPDPVVAKTEAHAAQQESVADAAGDRDQHEEFLAEQGVGEFGVDLVILPPEGNQAVDLGGVFQQHGERRLVALAVGGLRLGGVLRGCGSCRGGRSGGIGLRLLFRGLRRGVFGP